MNSKPAPTSTNQPTNQNANRPPGIYYEQGKLDAAIDAYQRALAAEPNFPEAYNNLGNALREVGRAEEAIGCYTACIQQQYARAAAAGGTAAVAAALQQAGGAAAAAAAAAGGGAVAPAAIAPVIAQRLGVAYNNLGGLLKMTGQAAAAIACYEQVGGCRAGMGRVWGGGVGG